MSVLSIVFSILYVFTFFSLFLTLFFTYISLLRQKRRTLCAAEDYFYLAADDLKHSHSF